MVFFPAVPLLRVRRIISVGPGPVSERWPPFVVTLRVTASAWPSVRLKPPWLVNVPRLAILLFFDRFAPPVDLPVRVAVLIVPPVWLIVVLALRATDVLPVIAPPVCPIDPAPPVALSGVA